MAVQCPFCKEMYTESVLRDEMEAASIELEGCQCDCGAWWYEGMEDVE
jgi:hypothetical protein